MGAALQADGEYEVTVVISPTALHWSDTEEEQAAIIEYDGGTVFVRFDMAPAAVDRLIALGWLNSESRRDPYAVTAALLKFGTLALWPNDDV